MMVCRNMCVMLLSMKRDFVREMKKNMEIFRDMAQNEESFRLWEMREGSILFKCVAWPSLYRAKFCN